MPLIPIIVEYHTEKKKSTIFPKIPLYFFNTDAESSITLLNLKIGYAAKI